VATDAGREALASMDTIVFASDHRSHSSVAELAKAIGVETYVTRDADEAGSENAGAFFANIAHVYDVARLD
jgi:CMP-2-keto-3-deoxyoctulosonic acid synthetase